MKRIKVFKSSIHGRGIFADETISKGERITYIRGPIKQKTPRGPRDSKIIGNWIGVAKDTWIKPEAPYMYLNHSCNPNSALITKRLLIALRPIARNEEITMDYSLTDSDLHWGIRCSCGARNCRKHIRAIQTLSPRIFRHYLPHIPPYFQKVYAKAHTHG